MPRAINAAALELVKEFEGFVNHAYTDPATGGEPLTIGYGHTSKAGPPKVTKGMQVTKAEAEAILARDLAKFAATLESAIKVKVTDNQFGACVSLAYNIGETAFLRSTLLKLLNAADYAGAAEQFSRWNKAGGKVMAGLSRRRAAEKALFLTPDAKPSPQPIPQAKPVPAPTAQPDARNGLIGWGVAAAVAIAGAAVGVWNVVSHFIQGVLS